MTTTTVVSVNGKPLTDALATAKFLDAHGRWTSHFVTGQPVASDATIRAMEADLAALHLLEREAAPHGSVLERLALDAINELEIALVSLHREEQPELTWGTVAPWWGPGVQLTAAQADNPAATAAEAQAAFWAAHGVINAARLQTAARVELAKRGALPRFDWGGAWRRFGGLAKKLGAEARAHRAVARAADRLADEPVTRPEFLTSEWFEGEESGPESDGSHKYPTIAPAHTTSDLAEMAITAYTGALPPMFFAKRPDPDAGPDMELMLAAVASPPPRPYSGPQLSARYADDGPLF